PQRRWVGCPDEGSERRRLVGVPADIPDRLLHPPRPPRPTGLLLFTAGGLHAGLRGEAQDGSVGLGGFCCLGGFDGGGRPCEVGRILTPGTAAHLPCVVCVDPFFRRVSLDHDIVVDGDDVVDLRALGPTGAARRGA